jgi:peptidoglycan/LPS O-acetylase OafA/YrhL
LHVPLGYRVSNTIIGELAVSIAGAALLHRYVEQPALRLAGRIRYRGARQPSTIV